MGNETINFNVPERAYSLTDAYNRGASAVGSPALARSAESAGYNGHCVHVSYNDFRGYYVAYYSWAGINTIARGSFEECLRASRLDRVLRPRRRRR
jgi:hypothetical protein